MWNSANSSNSYVASDGLQVAGYCYLNIHIWVMVYTDKLKLKTETFLLGFYYHY